jgi:hypothetical protein
MSLFFLICDLRSRRKYNSLYNELNDFGATRILETTWCFNRSDTNICKLRDYFARYIDLDDALVILEASNWASRNTNDSPGGLKPFV